MRKRHTSKKKARNWRKLTNFLASVISCA